MDGESQQKQLISKVQYDNFETGEFTDSKQRTFEQIIHLIDEFPWQQQREHFSVGLTNPSVTIEGDAGDFLKLAPYYHDKFILYYNIGHKLYSRSFGNYRDAIPVIRSFYDGYPFSPEGFKDENTWLRTCAPHFRSDDFRYIMGQWKLYLAVFLIALFIFLLFTFLIMARQNEGKLSILFGLMALNISIVLIAITRLFLNHYQAVKGKVLIISRGLDTFQYGPLDSPANFRKTSISEVVTHGRPGRHGYPPLTRVEICFKDGTSVDISCLMINYDTLIAKFPDCPQRLHKVSFCFIPRAYLAPS